MNDIIMGKDKKVGDDVLITDLGEGMVVYGVPDVARNPMTGELEKIKSVVKTPKMTICPKCGEKNGPGVDITLLESGIFIYACPKCEQFIWCKEHKSK